MHVFVTGSTGFVGSSVVKELLAAGHTVSGLTRSDKGAEQLKAQNVEVVRGTIEDVALLEATAAKSDAVIHLAFIHDFARFVEACQIDRAAITALGNGLVKAGGGVDRSLVVTSGTMMISRGEFGALLTEDSPLNTESPISQARGPSEQVCLDFAKPENGGIRASVVRLAPVTHAPGGRSGFAGLLVNIALTSGKSAYVGQGLNQWSAGHKDDAAVLYRLAAEKAVPGSVYHANGEQGVQVKVLAETIGKELGLPVESIEGPAAMEHFKWFMLPCTTDNIVSSEKTQKALGWTPKGATLLEELPTIVAFVKSDAAAAH
ncbi:hypothetical protein SCUCBS95973_009646 [Sporothrix curviconia]|uniref:NAD-dependent epimerase/dehydratase domain-containing protein n=1 Tax=Sporothrix curviconia TaxID=1260050 RepID=A0ABP0D087_9PEZI